MRTLVVASLLTVASLVVPTAASAQSAPQIPAPRTPTQAPSAVTGQTARDALPAGFEIAERHAEPPVPLHRHERRPRHHQPASAPGDAPGAGEIRQAGDVHAEPRTFYRRHDSPAGGTTPGGASMTRRRISRSRLYFAAIPVQGVEGQYGGLYIVKGESTELTTYDEDGYIIGERVSVRRPKELFFDEISATVGISPSDPREIPISKRTKYLNDAPNYRHFLVDKKFGSVLASRPTSRMRPAPRPGARRSI